MLSPSPPATPKIHSTYPMHSREPYIRGRVNHMIGLLVLFAVLAFVFGILGFTGIAAGFMAIARVIFFILLVIVIVVVILFFAGVALI